MDNTHNKKSILIRINSILRYLVSSKALVYYLYILSIISLFGIFSFAITPEKYEINVGQIAPKTIVATSNIVDTITTEKNRNDASRNVEPVYVNVDVENDVLNKLKKIFEEFNLVEKYGLSIKEGLNIIEEDIDFNSEHITYAKSLIKNTTLSEHQIQTLLNMSNDELQILQINIESAIRSTLKTSIREGYLNQTKDYIIQLLAYKVDIDVLQNLARPILDAVLIPNMIIDKEATEAAREKAASTVEDVVYQKGQNIVLEGNRIYQYQYQMIKDLGLISDGSYNLMLYISLFIFVVLTMSLSKMLIHILRPRFFEDNILVITFLLALILDIVFCVITRFIDIYYMPILLATILISVLIGSRIAIVTNIVSIMLCTLLFYGNSNIATEQTIYILIGNFVGGILAIWILHRHQRRQTMLFVALVAGLSNLLIMLLFKFYYTKYFEPSLADYFACFLSPFIAVLLAMALQILFENIFGLTTKNKLLELSNTEHPLLRRLLLEAPGTYHHCMLVANLAEGAANSIGADSLLVKVGAYFHDIGKIYKPQFFTENQTKENPHDNLSPYESAEIVIGHVRKGIQMAKENRLPKNVRDFIPTHHGDSVTLYFYNKALEMSDDSEVDINKFKYDGPKPFTKEQTILMLADSVEAAVRSLSSRTQEDIITEIDKIIKLKMKEHQFDESTLSIREINQIEKSFLNTLSGTYHERVKYPKIIVEDE